jgi:hypothetical protein
VASWAHVGLHKAAAAAASRGSNVAAVQLLPSVGSGAFMFAVGQASDTHAGYAAHARASGAAAAPAPARSHRQH